MLQGSRMKQNESWVAKPVKIHGNQVQPVLEDYRSWQHSAIQQMILSCSTLNTRWNDSWKKYVLIPWTEHQLRMYDLRVVQKKISEVESYNLNIFVTTMYNLHVTCLLPVKTNGHWTTNSSPCYKSYDYYYTNGILFLFTRKSIKN